MIDYVKQENSKDDFDGFDAKDVNNYYKLTGGQSMFIWDCLQLAARFTISVVSNSIYNVDPKSFEGQKSEILEKSQVFASPSKRFMINAMITTIYPFLSKYLKLSFSQPGAEKFYIDLMNEAIKYREESKIQRVDYLDHLLNLKNKKELSGQS